MDRIRQRGSVSESEERSPTEVYSSDDELMRNPSGNRTPLDPESFIQALQDAPSHSPVGLGQFSAPLGHSSQTSRASGSVRDQSVNRSSAPYVRNAGQTALPAAGYNPTSAAPSEVNAAAGTASQIAVQGQSQVSRIANVRNVSATDPRGNTLYLQQVLQQIQQNPDPRIIENLAEVLHKSKIETLEQEVQTRYSNETRRVEELYHQEAVGSVAAHEQAIAQSAVHAIQSQEQSSEAIVQRLREELNLAQMAQATASSSASEADRRLAEVYAEAQAAVQRVQVDSNQQNALLKQELETSQNNYAIQGGKLKTHITELAEQKLFAEKLTGEVKEQQRMLAEQRTLLQEQTEQTRVLMSDYRSLKDEFELLKERRERKESPKVDRRTEGKMPEPEEPPSFSSFPSKPQDNKASESKDASRQQEDPFNRNDPWGGYKPTGEAGVFDDLGEKPNKETPEGNPTGENAVQATLPKQFCVN